MIKNKLIEKFPENERKNLLLCFVSTFIFGIAAHAYGLLNDIFSHDSLNALYSGATENMSKISVGRFLVPAVRAFRGPVAIPWVIGLLAMCWIALSTYIILKMFDVRSKPAAVILSGFMVTNATVTAITATYVHELDIDMFALFLSCLAAYLWKESKKITGLIPVVILSVMSMAIYQSYAEVTVTLIILELVLETLENGKTGEIFVRGVKGAASIGLGAGIYFALNRLMCVLFKTETLDRVNVAAEYEESFIQRVYLMFKSIAIAFFTPSTVISTVVIAAVNVLVFAGIAAAVIVLWKKNRVAAGGKVFTLLLFAMLPAGMNFVCLFTHENVHDVMIFSFWMIYAFAVALFFRNPFSFRKESRKTLYKTASFVFAGVLLWNNILVSNTAYLKKDMEQEATLSMINRIVDDLEEREDYVVGESEIAFSGYPEIHKLYPGFEKVSHMIGLRFTTTTGAVAYTSFFNGYDNLFRYYLNYPANVSDTDYSDDSRVAAMPSFPEEGYIQNLDGVIVIKLGEKKLPKLDSNNLEKDIKEIIDAVS